MLVMGGGYTTVISLLILADVSKQNIYERLLEDRFTTNLSIFLS